MPGARRHQETIRATIQAKKHTMSVSVAVYMHSEKLIALLEELEQLTRCAGTPARMGGAERHSHTKWASDTRRRT